MIRIQGGGYEGIWGRAGFVFHQFHINDILVSSRVVPGGEVCSVVGMCEDVPNVRDPIGDVKIPTEYSIGIVGCNKTGGFGWEDLEHVCCGFCLTTLVAP